MFESETVSGPHYLWPTLVTGYSFSAPNRKTQDSAGRQEAWEVTVAAPQESAIRRQLALPPRVKVGVLSSLGIEIFLPKLELSDTCSIGRTTDEKLPFPPSFINVICSHRVYGVGSCQGHCLRYGMISPSVLR